MCFGVPRNKEVNQFKCDRPWSSPHFSAQTQIEQGFHFYSLTNIVECKEAPKDIFAKKYKYAFTNGLFAERCLCPLISPLTSKFSAKYVVGLVSKTQRAADGCSSSQMISIFLKWLYGEMEQFLPELRNTFAPLCIAHWSTKSIVSKKTLGMDSLINSK